MEIDPYKPLDPLSIARYMSLPGLMHSEESVVRSIDSSHFRKGDVLLASDRFGRIMQETRDCIRINSQILDLIFQKESLKGVLNKYGISNKAELAAFLMQSHLYVNSILSKKANPNIDYLEMFELYNLILQEMLGDIQINPEDELEDSDSEHSINMRDLIHRPLALIPDLHSFLIPNLFSAVNGMIVTEKSEAKKTSSLLRQDLAAEKLAKFFIDKKFNEYMTPIDLIELLKDSKDNIYSLLVPGNIIDNIGIVNPQIERFMGVMNAKQRKAFDERIKWQNDLIMKFARRLSFHIPNLQANLHAQIFPLPNSMLIIRFRLMLNGLMPSIKIPEDATPIFD